MAESASSSRRRHIPHLSRCSRLCLSHCSRFIVVLRLRLVRLSYGSYWNALPSFPSRTSSSSPANRGQLSVLACRRSRGGNQAGHSLKRATGSRQVAACKRSVDYHPGRTPISPISSQDRRPRTLLVQMRPSPSSPDLPFPRQIPKLAAQTVVLVLLPHLQPLFRHG